MVLRQFGRPESPLICIDRYWKQPLDSEPAGIPSLALPAGKLCQPRLLQAGREAGKEGGGRALPSCRVRRVPLFAAAPRPPLLPATSALPSHKRIPVIPLERQSLIIPPSLSDETPKLAPYRNSFPGAERGWQHRGVGLYRPHRAGPAELSPRIGGSGPGLQSSPRVPGAPGLAGRCPPGRRQHVGICIELRPCPWGGPGAPAPPRVACAPFRAALPANGCKCIKYRFYFVQVLNV